MEKWVKDLKTLVGIQLTARQIAAFQRYEDELLDWNSRLNLTAIRDREGNPHQNTSSIHSVAFSPFVSAPLIA